MLNVLDLFSGIGGFTLGLESTGGFRTSAFCENDPKARKVLKKNFPGIPIHEDVDSFPSEMYNGKIDVITGGYPCQPFSVSGKRKGFDDERNKWPAMWGIIARVEPDWVIAENVVGHIKLGLEETLRDLDNINYTSRVFVIPASAVGALHERERVWIVAHSRRARSPSWVSEQRERNERASKILNDCCGKSNGIDTNEEESHRRAESRLGRVADGLSDWTYELDRLHKLQRKCKDRAVRLKLLGNAVVPQVVAKIGKAILEVNK